MFLMMISSAVLFLKLMQMPVRVLHPRFRSRFPGGPGNIEFRAPESGDFLKSETPHGQRDFLVSAIKRNKCASGSVNSKSSSESRGNPGGRSKPGRFLPSLGIDYQFS